MKPVLERELREGAEAWAPDAKQPTNLTGRAARGASRDVELNGYLIRADRSIVDVKVVDLCFDGCRIRTLVPLSEGEKLKLTVLGRGGLDAVARWYKDREAGLLFVVNPGTAPRQPRKAERIKVNVGITLRRSGQISFRVAAFDITRFGCKCEFVERPAIGERVFVRLPGLDSIEAVVCWVEDSSVGLRFERPVHPAVFDMLLMRLAAAD